MYNKFVFHIVFVKKIWNVCWYSLSNQGWVYFELFNDFRFLSSKPGTRMYFGRILSFPYEF